MSESVRDDPQAQQDPHHDGRASAHPLKNDRTVTPYDFAHPSHKLNSRLPVLEVVNEKLAKSLADALTARFHQTIEVKALEPSFEKYCDYVASLDHNISLGQFKCNPLHGDALVTIHGHLIFMLVDSFFGGQDVFKEVVEEEPEETEEKEGEDASDDVADDDKDSASDDSGDASPDAEDESAIQEPEVVAPPPERLFTPTEQRIIGRFNEDLFASMKTAWSSVMPAEPHLTTMLSMSQITSPANPSAVVVISRFLIKLGAIEGECHLVMPYSMLEPVRAELTNNLQKMREHDVEWLKQFSAEVMGCEIDLKGVFAESEITLAQLLALKVGDFIPLGQVQSVEFSSEDITLFDAVVGVSNGLVSASLSQWHTPTASRKR